MTGLPQQMQMVVQSDGNICSIYCEILDLAGLGQVKIRRASHVEPDAQGKWWADLAPVIGPKLGPFNIRSQALAAELDWLEQHITKVGASDTLSDLLPDANSSPMTR